MKKILTVILLTVMMIYMFPSDVSSSSPVLLTDLFDGDITVSDTGTAGRCLLGLHDRTPAGDLLPSVPVPGSVKIFRADGIEEITDGEYVGTGCIVRLYDGPNAVDEARAIVWGDLNGDGRVQSVDALITLKASVGTTVLDDIYYYAGSASPGDRLKSADALKILKYSVGTIDYPDDDGTVTVYVSPEGSDSSGNGSYAKPFATLAAARDAVRNLDKSRYTAVTVLIQEGIYNISEPLLLTSIDSGTESCPVTWKGEGNVSLSGGNILTEEMFAKAGGTPTCSRFPESSRNSILMLDLKNIGYTQSDIDRMYASYRLSDDAPMLCVDGELQTIARYPNDSVLYIVSGSSNGTTKYKSKISLVFDSSFTERARTWSSDDTVYTDGRLRYSWRSDRQRVASFDFANNTVKTYWDGGYTPVAGMPVFFYNIPEELDAPGEYYIDKDGILYYYPTEEFRTGHITLSGKVPCVSLSGVQYVEFSDMLFEAFTNTFNGSADHFTIEGCTIRNSAENAVVLNGTHNLIRDCVMYIR